MLPVAVQVPGCVVAAFRAGVSATALFNAATARNTPVEQSTPPSATRGMKKADREVDFVFIAIYLKVVRAIPVVRGFPLREEGQVELPRAETPNGLDADTYWAGFWSSVNT